MVARGIPITGYLDRFSHRPGETFSAYVSVRAAGPCRARLVRVLGCDPNPAGPGRAFEDLASVYHHRFNARPQEVRLGSHGVAPSPSRDPMAACTWSVLVWCARPGAPRAVLSEEDGQAAVVLTAGAEGVGARLSWPGGGCSLQTYKPLTANCWHRVWLAADPASGRVRLGQAAFDDRPAGTAEAHVHGQSMLLPGEGGIVLMAAEGAADPTNHFDGKLEAPTLLAGFLDPFGEPGPVLARWDFSAGIETSVAHDAGPQARHGHLVNMPTRAVVGSGWTGREMCWRHAPGEYAAIWFHADDLGDCGWRRSFTWVVPRGMRSGAYAMHITCGEEGTDPGEDWLPLYVLPARAGPFARLAFLAPTFTYQAYANHVGLPGAGHRERVAAWGAYPHHPLDFPVYGGSTHDAHPDGAALCFSSRLRPILTMRPGFLAFEDLYGSGLRDYPADGHLLGWLAARGLRYDVITDEDLDDDGPGLLENHRCVLTGTHPEYHTERTLDALKLHTERGGRLVYPGGHGFSSRIARRQDVPHLIESRRPDGGTSAPAAEPGDYYHQLDGQYGGQWRGSRRPPQALLGVGCSGGGGLAQQAQATHYRRLATSYAPANAWIFAGMEEDVIGDGGLSGGGAAGWEVDRADAALGTPEDAVVLARAETTGAGEPAAEMVYFETRSGGAVFATGSTTFCGSLWREGAFDGPVSRLLDNVLRRFLA